MKRLFLLTVLVLSVGCTRKQEHTLKGTVFGLPYEIRVHAAPEADLKTVEAQLVDTFEEAQGILNTKDPESELSKFNRTEKLTWVPASRPLVETVEMALRAAKMTNGAWDPTAGKLDELHRGAKPPSAAVIAQARTKIGYYLVEVRQDPLALKKSRRGVLVDLSALAPGFAADTATEVLKRAKFGNFRVQVGNCVRAQGAGPWTVRVASSSGQGGYETVELENRALAAVSGGDAPAVDPRTGNALDSDLTSVSVVDPLALRAQSLAVAFFAAGKLAGTDLALKQTTGAYFVGEDSQLGSTGAPSKEGTQ